MSKILADVKQEIDDLDYDNWQIYFCAICIVLSVGLYFDIQLVRHIWTSIDNINVTNKMTLSGLLFQSVNGVIVGIFGYYLYDSDQRYYKFMDEEFDTKETALIVKVGLMTIVGVALSKFIPSVVRQNTIYPTLQTLGIVILLGYLLLHLEIDNWKIKNELPVLIGSGLLIVIPLLI